MHQAGFGHGAVVSHGQKGFQYAVKAKAISVGGVDGLGEQEAFPEMGLLSQVSNHLWPVELVEPALPDQGRHQLLGCIILGDGQRPALRANASIFSTSSIGTTLG